MLNIELGDDVDLTVVQGANFARVLRLGYTDVTDPEAPVRVRIPTNGYSGRGQVRLKKALTADLLMDFTVVVSQITDVNNVDCGRIDITASAAATAAMSHSGFYNVELFQTGEVVRVMQGRATLDKDVTAP